MIKLDKGTVLTTEIILKIINNHKYRCLPRLQKLKRYYEAKNDIMNRVQADSSKPNNKIANNYAGYITDTLTGYFVGEPITYNHADDSVLERLIGIFSYNDEADENTELAKDASIYGIAFEQVYIDEDSQLRFYHLPVEDCIPIYDTTIEGNLLYFIRYYLDWNITNDERTYIIEVIDENEVKRYRAPELLSSMTLIEEEQHYFGMVPIAIYKNNEDEIGDFEKVIALIDAYDKAESDNLNDFEYFTDAYLALYGFTASADEVKSMKENRVLLMDEGTSAEWLVKDLSGEALETMKSRLDNDIHKFSFCPNMSDENFASNASGIAIKFKTMGTENLVSIKERKFKKGLQMRLELIANIDNKLNSGFDWREVEIAFTRNIPTNNTELAQVVNTLAGHVSDETLLTLLPFVDDVQTEMERLEEQRDKEKESNPLLSSLTYQTRAMASQSKEKNEEMEKDQ